MLCYFSFTVQYTETFWTRKEERKSSGAKVWYCKVLVYNFNFFVILFFSLQQNWNLIKSFYFLCFFRRATWKTRRTTTVAASKQARSRMSPSFIFFLILYFYRIQIIHFLIPFSKSFSFIFFIFFMNKHRRTVWRRFRNTKGGRLHFNRKNFVLFFFISLAFLFMSFQLNLIGGKWNRTMQTPYHILIQAYTLECVCFIRFKIGGHFLIQLFLKN